MAEWTREEILAKCQEGSIAARADLVSGKTTLRYCRELFRGDTLEEAWAELLAADAAGKAPGHDWEYEHDPCGKSWDRCTRCNRTRRN